MRRPNVWIAIPSLVAGAVGGFLGWVVTDVSCRIEIDGVVHHCPQWSIPIALIGFLVGVVGVATMLSLVYRSLAEAREQEPQR